VARDVYHALELLGELQQSGQPYHEFLKSGSMSVGLYHLTPGEPDRQRPHTEDEVYYVLAGEGAIDVDGRITRVQPGSLVYVGRGVSHHFFDYSEGLTLLVVFAPERGSLAP
jgi:mannose-6-phosphate isomerase-like protein (cupin superfamily)